MHTTDESQNQSGTLSPNGRGGIWLAVVFGAIFVGVIWSGIFAGSTGIYGDSGTVSIQDTFTESIREGCRLILFTLLLCATFRIYAWKDHKQLGNFAIFAARCFAIIAAIESIRIAQFPHGVVRLLLISIAQYVVFILGALALFSLRLKEAILFVTSCSIGVVLVWLGTHLSTWLI